MRHSRVLVSGHTSAYAVAAAILFIAQKLPLRCTFFKACGSQGLLGPIGFTAVSLLIAMASMDPYVFRVTNNINFK